MGDVGANKEDLLTAFDAAMMLGLPLYVLMKRMMDEDAEESSTLKRSQDGRFVKRFVVQLARERGRRV